MPKVSLKDIEINYRDEGRGDNLVMIHNLTSNIEGFAKNIPEFSKSLIFSQNRTCGVFQTIEYF